MYRVTMIDHKGHKNLVGEYESAESLRRALGEAALFTPLTHFNGWEIRHPFNPETPIIAMWWED